MPPLLSHTAVNTAITVAIKHPLNLILQDGTLTVNLLCIVKTYAVSQVLQPPVALPLVHKNHFTKTGFLIRLLVWLLDVYR